MLESIIRCTNGLTKTGGNLQKGHTVAKSFTGEEISQEYEQKRRDSCPAAALTIGSRDCRLNTSQFFLAVTEKQPLYKDLLTDGI